MLDEGKNNITEKEKEHILEIYKQSLKKSYKLENSILKFIKIITISMGIVFGTTVILILITSKLIDNATCIWAILIGYAVLIIGIFILALIAMSRNRKNEVIEDILKKAYGVSDVQS